MKRLFILIFMTLMSLSFVSATLNNSQIYYSFEYGNFTDLSGNGNTGTNFGTINTTGILDSARDFDGLNDYITNSYNGYTDKQSVSFWINFDSVTTTQEILMSDVANVWGIRLKDTNDGSVDGRITARIGGTYTRIDGLNPNTWYHIAYTMESGSMKTYLNGVLQNTNTTAYSNSTYTGLVYGEYYTGAFYLDGTMDEFGLYARILNTSEISDLYNGGSGYNPYAIIPPSGAVVTINNPIDSEYLNNLNFTLNVTTDLNTNLSYSLNGASNISLGTNINSSVSTITGVEGVNNLSVYSNYSGEITSDSVTFTIDTIQPNISIIGNITQDSFQVNFSEIFNVTDINLDTCTINITYLENVTNASQYDKFINCADTVLFEASGLYNGYLVATDLAGNINTLDINGTINPLQCFWFQDSDLNYISNYTFGGFYSADEQLCVPLSDIGLGTKDLDFEKLGFVTTTFTEEFNITSDFNKTYSVVEARVEIYVYDQLTTALIDNETINLDLIGATTLNLTTTNGVFNISAYLIPGDYQAFVTTTNYISNQKLFTFDSQSVYTSNIYLLPYNATETGFVILRTYKSDGTFAPEIEVTANQWDTASKTFIETYRTQTNTNGQAVMPIILQDKIYKFCADYPIGTTCFPTGILGQEISAAQNGEEIPILPAKDFPGIETTYDDLSFTLLNNDILNFTTNQIKYNISYLWANTKGFDSTVCAKLEKDFNFTKTLVVPLNCSVGSSGIFGQIYILNNSFSYLFTVYEIQSDGSIKTLFKDPIAGNDNLKWQLDNFNITNFIILLFIVLMVAAIPFIKYPLLIVFDVVLVFYLMWEYLLPQSLSITTVGVFIVMGIVTLWAVSKK